MSPTLHHEAILAMRDWYRSAHMADRICEPDPVYGERLTTNLNTLTTPSCKTCGDPLVITDSGGICRQCRLRACL